MRVKTEPYEIWDDSEQVFHAENIGFLYDVSQSSSFVWDEEKYPDLITWNISSTDGTKYEESLSQSEINGSAEVWASNKEDQYEDREQEKTEAYMKTHFTSLLRYMADHGTFLNMMAWNGNGISIDADGSERGAVLREAADYVEQKRS